MSHYNDDRYDSYDPYEPTQSDFDKGYALGKLHGAVYEQTKAEIEIQKLKLDHSAKCINLMEEKQTEFNRGFEEGKKQGPASTVTPSLNKIAVIRFVREKFGIGLKEAKDFVDANIKEDTGEWSRTPYTTILPLIEKIYSAAYSKGVMEGPVRVTAEDILKS